MNASPKVYSYARYSSMLQSKGYSLERQLKRAREWCTERGYTLEESHSDEGKSAYHGDHIANGSLGLFLADVKAGRIPPGSILLLEQLDRLTRQNLHTAQGIVHGILGAGIRIVTIGDNQEYIKEQGLGGAVMLLVALEASHMESERKSDRLCESWEKRHEKALSGKIIGKNVPGWLRVTNDKFELVTERVDQVCLMFRLALEGMGVQAIASEFNRRGISTWRNGKPWAGVTVYSIVNSKRVLGELELKLTKKGRDGQPDKKESVYVPNYFPSIISETDFYLVQKSLKEKTIDNGKKRAGRNGGYNNLFSGICFCNYCGSKMVIIDPGPKRGTGRLRHKFCCDTAKHGRGCKYTSFPYQPFEDAIIQYCTEIDYGKLISTGEDKELIRARERFQKLKSNALVLGDKIETGTDNLFDDVRPEIRDKIKKKLNEYQDTINAVNVEMASVQREVDRLSRTGNNLVERLEVIRILNDVLKNNNEDTRIETRRKLRHVIGEAIESITCYPNGLAADVSEPRFKDFGPTFHEAQDPAVSAFYIEQFISENTGRSNASFKVKFKNGHRRDFKWNDEKKAFMPNYVESETDTAMHFDGIGLLNTNKGPGGFSTSD